MSKVEDVGARHCPSKSWGWEEWVVNNDLYCGKRLHFTKEGGSTSLHFHIKKHETMYVEKGEFVITVVESETAKRIRHYLIEGDSIVITPGCVHRIEAARIPDAGEAILVEFSTHHEDSDSYRVER